VYFRAGDALHVPKGPRTIVERGLRDPRVEIANLVARREMGGRGVKFLDTHGMTKVRDDKTEDGYHYFAVRSEVASAKGREVCAGNSVAKTIAQGVLNAVFAQCLARM
jgi:hypothetical protein